MDVSNTSSKIQSKADLYINDVEEDCNVIEVISQQDPKSETNNLGNRPSRQGKSAKKLLPNLLEKSLVVRLKKTQIGYYRNNVSSTVNDIPEAWGLLPDVRTNRHIESWRLKTADVALYKQEEYLVDANHDRKAISAPAPAAKENSDEMNHSMDHKLSPVQEALENAAKLRQSIREDKLAGISTSASHTPSGQNIENKKNGRASTAPGSQEQKGSRKKHMTVADARFKPPPIPARFTFPKCKDFIVTEDQKIENVDVGWKMQSMFKRNTVESTTYKKNDFRRNTLPGRLCRSTFPVTDAMHKHGTSVSKRSAKALNKPGDWKICKFWKRSLDNGLHKVSPYQMAFEDIRIKLTPEDQCNNRVACF